MPKCAVQYWLAHCSGPRFRACRAPSAGRPWARGARRLGAAAAAATAAAAAAVMVMVMAVVTAVVVVWPCDAAMPSRPLGSSMARLASHVGPVPLPGF